MSIETFEQNRGDFNIKVGLTIGKWLNSLPQEKLVRDISNRDIGEKTLLDDLWFIIMKKED